jgi:tRNA dimethylallyltransferase
MATGKPVPTIHYPLSTTHFVPLWLGIKTNQPNLYKKIDKRLKQRLKAGMAKEVSKLHNEGLSWKRLESFGLEYKYISLFLQKKLAYDEMLTQLSFAIKHYSKRQLTWWKRNKEIKWVKPAPKFSTKTVSRFLNINS